MKKSVSDMTDLENLLMRTSQDERERAVFRSRRMYQTDMSMEKITKVTGVSLEALESLRGEN